MKRRLLVLLGAVSIHAGAGAQATLQANSFVFQSTGQAEGNLYNLWTFGYIGTFVNVPTAGKVTLQIQAEGAPALGVWPIMAVHIGNQTAQFTVSRPAVATYTMTVSLPAGMTMLRVEFLNDYSGNGQDRNLLIQSATISGVKEVAFVNPTDAADLKTAVFAAADATIENYRKQTASVQVLDQNGKPWPANAAINAQLTRHAFRFGSAAMGTGSTADLMWPNPTAGSTAEKYQTMLASNFNTLEEENAGKWEYDEWVEGDVTMQYVDAILGFAKAHGMSVRQHNVLWGSQQPNWAMSIENAALSANPVQAFQAMVDLTLAINRRIAYVVAARSTEYNELDGINEASAGHQPIFLNIYGYPGIAAIYEKTIDNVRAAGSTANVYFNDYNILNYNSDLNGEWYLQFIETVIGAGISTVDRARLGVGVQYYTDIGDHDPVRIYQSLANLGVLGLPISLTEFGVQGNDSQDAPSILADSVRLVFGTDQATTFNCWGFWEPDMWMDGAAMFDQNWNITPTGKVWQQMTGIKNWGLAGVPNWTTNVTLVTDATGHVSFRGFAGSYSMASGGHSGTMELGVGTAAYTVTIARS